MLSHTDELVYRLQYATKSMWAGHSIMKQVQFASFRAFPGQGNKARHLRENYAKIVAALQQLRWASTQIPDPNQLTNLGDNLQTQANITLNECFKAIESLEGLQAAVEKAYHQEERFNRVYRVLWLAMGIVIGACGGLILAVLLMR